MPKITFEGNSPVPHETLLANIGHAKGLGLPYVKDSPPHGRRLAVVGGGPSVLSHLDELRSWGGDIWAINGACPLLKGHGIESTLFSLDPLPVIAKHAASASSAIVCSRCDPAVFEALKGADVQLFDVVQDDGEGIWASCSTALSVFDLATNMGYREIVFFGCEGSFEEKTHAYMDDPQTFRFVVACGGREYLTLPEMYVQTEPLALLLRTFPAHFSERCGGLLRAMVENEEHEIVKVSRALLAGLKPANQDRFDEMADFYGPDWAESQRKHWVAA